MYQNVQSDIAAYVTYWHTLRFVLQKIGRLVHKGLLLLAGQEPERPRPSGEKSSRREAVAAGRGKITTFRCIRFLKGNSDEVSTAVRY
jgi:hypothetical protein